MFGWIIDETRFFHDMTNFWRLVSHLKTKFFPLWRANLSLIRFSRVPFCNKKIPHFDFNVWYGVIGLWIPVLKLCKLFAEWGEGDGSWSGCKYHMKMSRRLNLSGKWNLKFRKWNLKFQSFIFTFLKFTRSTGDNIKSIGIVRTWIFQIYCSKVWK